MNIPGRSFAVMQSLLLDGGLNSSGGIGGNGKGTPIELLRQGDRFDRQRQREG